MAKVLIWVVLLVLGVLSLPIAAWFLDGEGTENWILPVQLAAMALVGAVAGSAVPGFLNGTAVRRVAVGAACGIGAAAVGVLVFFLLLSGFEGA